MSVLQQWGSSKSVWAQNMICPIGSVCFFLYMDPQIYPSTKNPVLLAYHTWIRHGCYYFPSWKPDRSCLWGKSLSLVAELAGMALGNFAWSVIVNFGRSPWLVFTSFPDWHCSERPLKQLFFFWLRRSRMSALWNTICSSTICSFSKIGDPQNEWFTA